MKLIFNKNDCPFGALVSAELVKEKCAVNVEPGSATSLDCGSGIILSSDTAICRYFAKLCPDTSLYGTTLVEEAEVEHWLSFSAQRLSCTSQFSDALLYLDRKLEPVAYLVGDRLTAADCAVWGVLRGSDSWSSLLRSPRAPVNVLRYYNFLLNQLAFNSVNAVAPPQNTSVSASSKRKDEGKFVELPGAEMGKVVVRFPPEASGYLHVGHAKAALLNQHYQQSFNGKLIFRFDDTNPAKESSEFEKVILEDFKMLGCKYDVFSHTSDHFDLIMELCEKLIQEGKAYADDTDPEQMKAEREKRIESSNRNNSVEQNMRMWKEMKAGSEVGQRCCARAKLDMKSDNGCLRDPTIFRCKPEEHVRTGYKYKVYPTYDFACPIVDSVEGVTHALRTTEYHDRDDQYYWFIEQLGLRRPYIYEYSRLNLQNTVLSKRKLTWFVNEGVVDGWDDPRFPTVRGILRRGMTVEGLKQFIVAQGSSRSVNMMEWDKIWTFNKKVIDPVVPRFTALEESGRVVVNIKDVEEECKQVNKHPKDVAVGTKPVWLSPRVTVDGADAATLNQGEKVTLINWGNMIVTRINKAADGSISSIDVDPALHDQDFKKTVKLTWLAESPRSPLIPCHVVHFDNIITKGVLAKTDDFKDYVNRNSKTESRMLGEPPLADLKKGDIIQLQRRGFFICDKAYTPPTAHTCVAGPCVLFNVPDGHSKQMPSAGSKHKEAPAQKSSGSKKGTSSKSKASTAPSSTGSGDGAALDAEIRKQGDLVRSMKAEKKDKAEIDAAVKKLLALKSDFKTAVGKDWKPDFKPSAASAASSAAELDASVRAQGDVVRKLKADKAEKAVIDAAVKQLLALKADFKAVFGKDWKPDLKIPPAAASDSPGGAGASGASGTGSASAAELDASVRAQGDIVRNLKSNKGNKAEIDAAVKKLLSLKAEFKAAAGQDWKPDYKPPEAAVNGAASVNQEAAALLEKVEAQGNKVRQLKSSKAQKSEIDAAVEQLLALKLEYKKATGQVTEKAAEPAGEAEVAKKQTRLGLEVKKEENLSEWYSQVITKAEMIEYYDVSGCYILRPWSFTIWDCIRDFFDKEIKKIGVENSYFPIFVSQAALNREKDHIADFAPEVAWVTRSGESELAEPIAVRPTSETVMYPAYAKWIRSHRDLPLKLNQWNNVVRWEFKQPTPFLRTREFLWQEGHTAFATRTEAEEEVFHILEQYARVYEELLAIPVVRGRKTEKEKFAGGDFTTTVEAFISASGRGIQGATSHHLGQNFSKMFDIQFEDPETQEMRFVHQNSWGITTRTIGVMTMVHGDNKGLVLPPRVACVQVVIVPCGLTVNLSADKRQELTSECEKLVQQLKAAGVRARADLRDNYSPGWKFNHWELKGVPVRVELGPRDLSARQLVAVLRITGEKHTVPLDGAVERLQALLEEIHHMLYAKAKADLDTHMTVEHSWDGLCAALDRKMLIQAPFCGAVDCETSIKADSARGATVEEGAPAMGAKSLCIPLKQPCELAADTKCIYPGCKSKPKFYTLFGRSY